MGLNIKNDRVHDAVRELAERLAVSQTSAVEIAVQAKLAELHADDRRRQRSRQMRAAAAAAQEAFRGVDLVAIERDLFDDRGLPA